MIDDNRKKILTALISLKKPASGKEVAASAGLDAKLVSNEINKLKGKGFVDSPVRCKYGVTALGKEQL